MSAQAKPRFQLYVKQSCEGATNGTCPFSQRAYLVMLQKVPGENFSVTPVDLQNKPDDFLVLNPAGTAPVLVDHQEGDKVVSDSAEVVKYLEAQCPQPDLQCGKQCPAAEATAAIFSKFAAMMKNKDPAASAELRTAARAELQKMEDFLHTAGTRFLLGDAVSELDCAIFPRLNHIRVAGEYWKKFGIPEDMPTVRRYMADFETESPWSKICPTDQDTIDGWGLHGVTKED